MWMGVESYLLNRCLDVGQKVNTFGFWGNVKAEKCSQLTLKASPPTLSLNKTDDPPPLLWSHGVVFFRVCQFFFGRKKHVRHQQQKRQQQKRQQTKITQQVGFPRDQKSGPRKKTWPLDLLRVFLGPKSLSGDFLVGILSGLSWWGWLHPEFFFSKIIDPKNLTNRCPWICLRWLEQVKNILPNGGLMVIYHGTKWKVTWNKSKIPSKWPWFESGVTFPIILINYPWV